MVTYGSVNFFPLDTEVVEFFEVLDRYLYPLGPVETRPIDYFGFSLYLLSVLLASIKFLGFSFDFSLRLLSVFLQYNRNVLILY